jgi:hypothetical protein
MEKPIWANQEESRWPMVRIVVAACLALLAMYRFVPEAKPYFFALKDHTVTLLAGCGATVVLGMLQKYVLKKPLSLKWEVMILLAFVFFAGFEAWEDQYQKAAQAEGKLTELTKPKLTCKIGSLTFGKGNVKDEDVVAVIAGTITNSGGPTVLDYWTLSVRLQDNSIVRAEPIIPMGHGGRLTFNGPIGFDAADWWADRAQSAPIQNGGAASGWLYFVFRGDSWEKLKNQSPSSVISTSVILGVTDVNGKDWSFETPISQIPSASASISPADLMVLHINKDKSDEKGRVHRANPSK